MKIRFTTRDQPLDIRSQEKISMGTRTTYAICPQRDPRVRVGDRREGENAPTCARTSGRVISATAIVEVRNEV
jgi:hypothetical protein